MKREKELKADAAWRGWMAEIDAADWRTNKKFASHHGVKHAEVVARYAEKFLREIGTTEEEIEMGRITALLHDIGLTKDLRNHDGHAEEGAKMAKKWLELREYSEAEIEMISHAIAGHGDGKEIRGVIDAALCLGDKMDMAQERVRDCNGWIRETMSKIQKVEFLIGDEVCQLTYSTDVGFEVERLRVWGKCISVPERVAGWLGKGFEFLVNGEKMDVDAILAQK